VRFRVNRFKVQGSRFKVHRFTGSWAQGFLGSGFIGSRVQRFMVHGRHWLPSGQSNRKRNSEKANIEYQILNRRMSKGGIAPLSHFFIK